MADGELAVGETTMGVEHDMHDEDVVAVEA